MGPSALAASSSHHRCSGLKSRRIKRRKKLNIFCRCFLLFCSLPPRNFLATLRKKVLILELHDSVSIACSARQKEKYFLAPPSQSGVPTSELTFARFSVAFWAPSGGGGQLSGCSLSGWTRSPAALASNDATAERNHSSPALYVHSLGFYCFISLALSVASAAKC